MSVRAEKVGSLVKEEISKIIQRHFRMEDIGFVTVTEVRMTPDLKNARVYVSVFGDSAKKEKGLQALEEQKSFIRSNLGHNVRLKYTPALVFYLDDSLDRAMKIEGLINQIHKDEKENGDRS